MHPHEQYKNVPNKNKRDLKRNANKFPTTLNTTAKDKAQTTATNKERRKAYPHKQKARAKREAIKHNSAVKSRGTRDERAGASPTEARVSSSNHRTFPLKSPPGIERASRLSGPRRLLVALYYSQIAVYGVGSDA